MIPVGDARQHDVLEVLQDTVHAFANVGRSIGKTGAYLARSYATKYGIALGTIEIVCYPVHYLSAVAAKFVPGQVTRGWMISFGVDMVCHGVSPQHRHAPMPS